MSTEKIWESIVRNKMRSDLKTIKENLDIHFEAILIQSKIMKCKYDSLVSQGFTKEQALELCKHLGA